MSYLPPAAAALAEALHARGLLDVIKRRAAEYHVTLADILGTSRTKTVAAARHAAMRDLADLGLSTVEIGKLLDRDHCTVLAALGKTVRAVVKARVRCPVLAITRVI